MWGLFAFLLPLAAWTLEPSDPVSYCDRFLSDKDILKCQERTAKENVDWYAAALCNLQKEDVAFWACWDSAKDKAINPQALQTCAADIEASDQDRQKCLTASFNSRTPASSDSSAIFQPLKNPGKTNKTK